MNEWVIFFINFTLYSVQNLIMTIAMMYMLTPKYSKLKTLSIWYGIMLVGGTIKFLVPPYSKSDMVIACCNIAMCILASYLLCQENIFHCILSFGCVNMICVLSSLTWLTTPYAEATNWEIGTTIGYIISFPVAIAGFILILWVKRNLFDRRDFQINGRIAIFVLLIGLYYAMFSYIPIMLKVNVSASRETVMLVMEIAGVFVYAVILYMILKKSEELRYFKRSKELELARIKEQDIYDGLVGRMEHMEKIRHDFYGQVTVARHIVSQDRNKGMQMIKELEVQLEKVYEPE